MRKPLSLEIGGEKQAEKGKKVFKIIDFGFNLSKMGIKCNETL